jgi:peptidoglycan/xylan/chitin deacetylase (PgdA/CDA1 family)
MKLLASTDGRPVARHEDSLNLAAPSLLSRPMALTFHEIVDKRCSDLYKLSTDQFEEHLQVIQSFRRTPGANGPRIQITFDDGYLSDYQTAAPLLERYQMQAVFFVTAGMIGASPQHMRWGHLKELVALGHEVQSHTWSHLLLTDCSQPLLKEELLRARETLEERLALPVRKVAIPYGRYGTRVLKACAAAGYERVYTSDPWMGSCPRWGVQVCGRLSVRSTLNPIELRRLLTLKAVPYLCKRTKSRGKEAIKTFLGESFFRSVWVRRIQKALAVLVAVQIFSGLCLWQSLNLLLGT